MKPYVGIVKFHYLTNEDEHKETFSAHLYDIQEVGRTLSLYKYLKDNEIECAFNEYSEEIPKEWGENFNHMTIFVDDIVVGIGTDTDLWVIDVYLK